MSKYVEDEQFEQAMEDKKETDKPIHQITIGDVLVLLFNWAILQIQYGKSYLYYFTDIIKKVIKS